jgi:hypothetical protein
VRLKNEEDWIFSVGNDDHDGIFGCCAVLNFLSDEDAAFNNEKF